MANPKINLTGAVGPNEVAPFTDLSDQSQLSRLNTFLQDIATAIPRLSLGNGAPYSGSGNVNGQWVTVVTPLSTDQAFTIPHGLGRRPVAFFVGNQSGAGSLYDDGVRGSWTTNSIVLKCDGSAITFTILIV